MRIAFYSHDSFGLGHLSRCLKLATAMCARMEGVQGLIITGSPWAALFPPPGGFRYFHLAPVIKRGPGHYEARAAGADFRNTLDERRAGITLALEQFRPDLFVVDNVPCGLAGELRGVLERAREGRGPRLVLALRDLLDADETVRREWAEANAFEALDHCYDEIWVFGSPDTFDPRHSYGFSAAAADRVVFCGYLGASGSRRRPRRTAPRQRRRPVVLVTGGGGGDAAPLVREYCAALERTHARPDTRFVLGPDFPSEQVPAKVVDAGSTVTRFCSDLPAALADADAVVSMAGYNSTCEILEAGTPAVFVPRAWPREEQWLRANSLARRGHAQCLHPDELTPRSLWSAVECALDEFPTPWEGPNGAPAAAERAVQLLGVEAHAR